MGGYLGIYRNQDRTKRSLFFVLVSSYTAFQSNISTRPSFSCVYFYERTQRNGRPPMYCTENRNCWWIQLNWPLSWLPGTMDHKSAHSSVPAPVFHYHYNGWQDKCEAVATIWQVKRDLGMGQAAIRNWGLCGISNVIESCGYCALYPDWTL